MLYLRTSLIATVVMLALALPMNADTCVKCVARECVSGVSTEPAPARQWTLARVDVRPARRQGEVRWRLARVDVTLR